MFQLEHNILKSRVKYLRHCWVKVVRARLYLRGQRRDRDRRLPANRYIAAKLKKTAAIVLSDGFSIVLRHERRLKKTNKRIGSAVCSQ